MISGIKKNIRKWLFGTSSPEEYICIEKNSIKTPLTVQLSSKTESGIKNVTNSHLFLGYKPVLMAVCIKQSEKPLNDEVCMSFHQRLNNKSVAQLSLKKIKHITLGEHEVYIYEAIQGSHNLISRRHQFLNNLYQKIVSKEKLNINLTGNLYDQVRIAYCVPRMISLITVKHNNLMNLFPTDLHGAVGEDYYLSSLRITGKACQQVEQTEQVVISEISTTEFQKAYTLGKNHIKDLMPPETFETMNELSEQFRFPLPTGTIAYKELSVVDHFDIGVHRIFIYKVSNQKILNNHQSLTHVHAYYIKWLRDNSEMPKLLLRKK